jgi:hypothetical protein
MTMRQRDNIYAVVGVLLLLLLMVLILISGQGCTAKRVTTSDGTVIESYGCLAGHQLQGGTYYASPTTRQVKIEGYNQDVDAAKVLGQAVLEALKKAP